MGTLTRSTPVAMPGGRNRFIIPLYHEFLQHNGFTCVVDARDGRIVNQECQEIPGDGAIQPSLVWHKKQLYAFLRDREKASVRVARFNLGKLTWDKALATNLPNPNSSVAAVAAGEQILLAFNNHASERSPLTLALSDDALHFQPVIDLEPFGKNKEYSYPSLIQLKSGDFRVGYTYDYRSAIKVVELNRWPHKTLTEKWQHR